MFHLSPYRRQHPDMLYRWNKTHKSEVLILLEDRRAPDTFVPHGCNAYYAEKWIEVTAVVIKIERIIHLGDQLTCPLKDLGVRLRIQDTDLKHLCTMSVTDSYRVQDLEFDSLLFEIPW